MIHQKILEKKAVLTDYYGLQADTVVKNFGSEISDTDLRKFEVYKNLLTDVRAIPSWPISLDVGVKFVISTLLIPTLAAIVTTALKSGKIGG